MKAFAILPAVAAAIMTLNISAASSQEACQKEFMACMDSCGSRSAKVLQDSCFTSCEGQNTMCAERVYGKRPFKGTPSTAEAQKAVMQKSQAKDAMAKTENKAEQEPAVEPEQAPAPAPAPAQQKRAPARR